MALREDCEKARQYGTAYAKAMLAGNQPEVDAWFRRYLALPASDQVRLAFDWAAEDARLGGTTPAGHKCQSGHVHGSIKSAQDCNAGR